MSPINDRRGILIVEDEPLISSYMTDILQEFAFDVAGCASCAAEAIALAEQNRPRLAVVDIRLTGAVDGIEVASVLRDRFGVLTIFLSGAEDEVTIARARAAQPLGYLQKPFLPSQFLDALQAAMALGPANLQPTGDGFGGSRSN
jgi:DNA-binding NarL/FixJ family response regulator